MGSTPAAPHMSEKRRGGWQPGQSGNPAGRKPLGDEALTALRREIQQHAPAIVQSLIADALVGDVKAARLLLERALPPLKAEGAPVSLPGFDPNATLVEQARAVLAAMADGSLPPDVAAQVLAGVGELGKLRNLEEFEQRLAALEEQAKRNSR